MNRAYSALSSAAREYSEPNNASVPDEPSHMSRLACSLVTVCALLAAAFGFSRYQAGKNKSPLLDVGHFDNYYNEAERHMKKQWRQHVWPQIKRAVRISIQSRPTHMATALALTNSASNLPGFPEGG